MISPSHSKFSQMIAAKAASNPDFEILTFVTVAADGSFEGEKRTYKELNDNGQGLARYLKKQGTTNGDNFAVMMNNHPEFVETMVAAGILGAAFIPVDPRTMGAKLSYMLDFTECQGVICADYCLDSVLSVAHECSNLKWLIVVPTEANDTGLPQTRLSLIDYPSAVETTGEALPIVEESGNDAMFMLFTSGTTGNPKAVIFSHEKYMGMTLSPFVTGITQEDRYYTGLSLTHVNAQGTMAGALGQEIPAVLSRKFTKSRLWDIIRHYGCTTFNLLGGMIPEIYAMPEKPDDAENPVRFVQSSGMPAHLWEKFEKRFDLKLCESYGSTEGGVMFNFPGEGPVGSIGRPAFGGIAEILDEDGNICEPYVEGEICFRREDGGPVAVQYFKNQDACSDKVRGGWLHMGDLGHKDENGWFFFHHRVGGGVRRNGDFVNTALVETVLAQSPLIGDVFVYGVVTAKNVSGEKTLVAAVVPAGEQEFDQQALLEYCNQHLEKNDVPEIIQVLTEIPKTISEKPIEKACIELLAAQGVISA
jgi:crotonobetaine/carnitine-CoA ligase